MASSELAPGGASGIVGGSILKAAMFHFSGLVPWGLLADDPLSRPSSLRDKSDIAELKGFLFHEEEDWLLSGYVMRERASECKRDLSFVDGLYILGSDGRGSDIPKSLRGDRLVLTATVFRDLWGCCYVAYLYWPSWSGLRFDPHWRVGFLRLDRHVNRKYVLPDLRTN